MILTFFKKNIVILIVLILAGIFRLAGLDKIPSSLNPDEVALGYNAFSILRTGADEHGAFIPLAMESFGDWKLPVYSYSAMIPIGLLGLNEVSVRLPSAIAGVLGVLFVYLISKSLFKNKNINLTSAFLFAISPWSIYFSRAAYEVNLTVTIFLAAFLSWLKFLEDKRSSYYWLMLASFLFGITTFTYNAFIVFTPLFLIGLIYIYWTKIKFRLSFLIPVIVILCFFTTAFFSSFFISTNKTETLLVFNDKNAIYNRAEKLRGDGAGKDIILEKLMYNKYSGGAYQFFQNYLAAFSPTFLFDKGGEKLVHNLGYFGNLYLIDALFIVAGLFYLSARKEPSLKILFLWLILSPIPSALTREPQNSTRLFILLPVLVIISSYGLTALLAGYRKKMSINTAVKTCILVLFTFNISLFMSGYFIHMNTQRARFWKYGYKQAVEIAKNNPTHNVVMRGPENFPYIYFLFYNQYDSGRFINEVEYYPPTNEGFRYVKSFGRYSFVSTIDYSDLSSNTIYIDDINPENGKNKIFLPSGEPILSYVIEN